MRMIGIISLVALFFGTLLWLFQHPAIKDSPNEFQVAKPEEIPLTEKANIQQVKVSPTNKNHNNRALDLKVRSSYLISCFKKETCNYPQTDPRSYGYALGEDMIKLLSEAIALQQRNEFDQQQLRELSHHYLDVPNGHVQAKVVEILETLPINQETFSKLEQVFSNNFDSVLLAKSMSLLESYHQQNFSTEVDNLLLQQVQTGGHFVRQTLSAQVLPFINDTNIERYQAAAQALPKNSLESQQLHAVLKEYQLMKQGG